MRPKLCQCGIELVEVVTVNCLPELATQASVGEDVGNRHRCTWLKNFADHRGFPFFAVPNHDDPISTTHPYSSVEEQKSMGQFRQAYRATSMDLS